MGERLEEAGALVDELHALEGLEIDPHERAAGACVVEDVIGGDHHVGGERRGQLFGDGSVARDGGRFRVDLEDVVLEVGERVLGELVSLWSDLLTGAVEEVLRGVRRDVPAGRREFHDARFVRGQVEDAELACVALVVVVHGAVADVAPRRRDL